MQRAERETMILANKADADDGFFVFYTTEPGHFARLCRRIGGQDVLLGCEITLQEGRPIAWNCKVPIRFMSKSNFGVRVAGSAKRKGNPDAFRSKA